MLKRIISSFQARYPSIAARLFNEIPLEEVPELNSRSKKEWLHTIPNNVYMAWEKNAFGKTHAAGLRQFRARNTDCNFHFFDSQARIAYMNKFYGDHPINDVFKSAKAGAMKVDIWRYCILYERGGFYFDINKCIEVPLSNYLLRSDVALLSYENNLLINVLPKELAARLPLILPPNAQNSMQFIDRPLLNWGLACVRGHPLYKKTIENIVDNAGYFRGKSFVHMREPIIELTGPIMFTRSFYDCLREGIEFSARQCGIDFDGNGNPNMKGGWVRYLLSRSYVRNHNTSIL